MIRENIRNRSTLVRSILICVLLLTQCVPLLAEIIPAARRIKWDPGVRGDIPNRTTIFANVKNSPYNALGNGVADDTAGIQAAINACPSNQVIYIPAGTYKISAPLSLKDGITVRGAGITNTVIKGASSYIYSQLISVEKSGWDWDFSQSIPRDLVSGYAKGSTNITTSTAHGWSAGDFVLIDQLDDPTADPPINHIGNSGACTWCGRGLGARPLGQWVKVMSVPTATSATIDPPLYWNYNGAKSPQGYKLNNTTQYAGVESLTLDNSVSAARYNVVWSFAVNCWLLNIEMKGSEEFMVKFYGGLWNTIRGCAIHDGTPATPTISSAYGPSRAYGLYMNVETTANLIENNQFYALSFPISLEGGPSGNVIAYNVMTNIYYIDTDWARQTVDAHGAHPMMNLVEGNWSADKFAGDIYWGTSSHQTYFRNRVFNNPNRAYGTFTIDFQKGVRYNNVVGNVIGNPGDNAYELAGGSYAFPGAKSIYRLGYDGVDSTGTVNFDTQVKATLLRHGNWDSVNQAAVWDSAISDRTLPASLYLTSKPSWWGNLPWPAIGPDLSPMAGLTPVLVSLNGGGGSAAPQPPTNLRIAAQ